jgi:membrane-associated phospholipid phosphatase
LLVLFAFTSYAGRSVDVTALGGLASLNRSATIHELATWIPRICDTAPFALASVALAAFALATRGPRRTAAMGVLLIGANVSSQILKPATGLRDVSAWPGVSPIHSPSFPSGHATAAMSLALALVLVAPRAWRPIAAAVGGVFVVAVGLSVVIETWHYPSDVVGGFLLATGWALVALAGLRAAEARWPTGGTIRGAARIALAPLAAPLLACASIAALALLALHARGIASFTGEHTTAVGVAGAIAATGAGLLAAVTKLADRPAR